jgi:queuine tRNA-ribosyltransferase
MTALSFELLNTDGKARRGRLHTAHGTAETPAFMAVGTAATVKAMTMDAVKNTGTEIVLGNTYHLMLRPSAERIDKLGGLHKFMLWPGPILTDSGGFQVMSLSKLRKITEKGVTFRSHIDGAAYELNPERSTEIQHLLDATITMAFDECPKLPAEKSVIEKSMELSMRWAARSRTAFKARPGYGQFGIVQGGTEIDLRIRSAQALSQIGFEGYAVGGLAVGEPQEQMFAVLDETVPALPANKPHYLMGVGTPLDIIGAVERGIDMFDCVLPTRSGRTAQAFTSRGTLNLRNARHQDDYRPLDEECQCPALAGVTRAYLHHLIRCEEILGPMLLTWHNIYFYQNLMRRLRLAIEQNRFAAEAASLRAELARGDIGPLG